MSDEPTAEAPKRREPMAIALKIAPTGAGCRIELDGHDVSNYCRAVTVHADVNEISKVTLELVMVEVTVEGEAVVNGVNIPLIDLPDVDRPEPPEEP